MRRRTVIGLLTALILALVLTGLNAGALIDAVTYREATHRARALLPSDWRASATMDPEARLVILTQALSAAQALAADAQGATLRLEGGALVLALPIGLDTEILDLATGCFRFARRRVSLFVWHFYLSTGCL